MINGGSPTRNNLNRFSNKGYPISNKSPICLLKSEVIIHMNMVKHN